MDGPAGVTAMPHKFIEEQSDALRLDVVSGSVVIRVRKLVLMSHAEAVGQSS
jgi:hypothetical protein